jgi:hypothetical protein
MVQQEARKLVRKKLTEAFEARREFDQLAGLIERDLARMAAGERLPFGECWQVLQRCIRLMQLGLAGIEERPEKREWLELQLIDATRDAKWILKKMQERQFDGARQIHLSS